MEISTSSLLYDQRQPTGKGIIMAAPMNGQIWTLEYKKLLTQDTNFTICFSKGFKIASLIARPLRSAVLSFPLNGGWRKENNFGPIYGGKIPYLPLAVMLIFVGLGG